MQPCLWALLISGITALAEGQNGGNVADDSAFRKDVEILVDVSATMHPDTAKEAVQVVVDLIGGQFRRPESGRLAMHELWQPYEEEDPEMLDCLRPKGADGGRRFLFTEVDYFRRLFTGEGKVELLAGEYDQINLTFFGDRRRTLDPDARINHQTSDFHKMVKDIQNQKFTDQKTNLKLALAKIRERKGNQEGYYLFVISDCREEGEKNENDKELLKDWDPEMFKENGQLVTLLAHQPPGQVGRKFKPYICMMAVGFDPVVPKNEVAPGEVPKTKDVPKIGGAIKLLGGLTDETPKVFRNQVPFLSWQIEGLPGAEVNREVYVLIENARTKFTVKAMNKGERSSSSRISLDKEHLFWGARDKPYGKDLPPGHWKVTVKENNGLPEEENGLLKEANGNIVVIRERPTAVPIAILAGLTSLLLFVYSWWAIRQRRPAGAR